MTLNRKYVTLGNSLARFEYKSPGIELKSRSNAPMLLSNGPELVSNTTKSPGNAPMLLINGSKLVSNASKSRCNAPLQASYVLKYVTCVGVTRSYAPLFASYAAKSRRYNPELVSNV